MTNRPSDSDHNLLVRIDERTQRLEEDVKSMKEQYISRGEFEARFAPVQKLVFGLVGVILLSFFGAVATFFIK